ncbi:hypothetical protein FRB98_002556 [Tulasnella sp. 332]|nr:hypothetical protein FRB98_002556 [Tulasnella sp. 332]
MGSCIRKNWTDLSARSTGNEENREVYRSRDLGFATRGRTPVDVAPVSLALFFAALVEYLLAIEKTVALMILVFASAGGLLYGLMVVVAAAFTGCPFQTALSAGLRLLYHWIQHLFYGKNSPSSIRQHLESVRWAVYFRFRRHARFPAWTLARIITFISASFTFILQVVVLHPREPETSSAGRIYAVSAILIAEAAPHAENLLVIADNIPPISDFNALKLINYSTLFPPILSQLRNSLLILQSGSSDARLTDVVSLAQAIGYALLADPQHTADWDVTLINDWEDSSHVLPPMELAVPLLCIFNLWRRLTGPPTPEQLGPGWRNISFGLGLHEVLQRTLATNSGTSIGRSIRLDSTADLWFRHCVVMSTSPSNDFRISLAPSIYKTTGDVFLSEAVEVNAAYLTGALHVMLAALRRDIRPRGVPDLKSAWRSFRGYVQGPPKFANCGTYL